MTNVFESFNPQALFSADNPFIKATQQSHKMFAEAFDKSARLQLSLAEDLLELNSKRVAAIYAGGPIQERLSAQQEVLAETGNRLSTLPTLF